MAHSRQNHTETRVEESSLLEKLAGTIPATLLQMCSLHPADTITKRLSKNKQPISNVETFLKVIFLNEWNSHILKAYSSLYVGFLAGLQYKLLQTTYKFTFQPEVAKFLKRTEVDKTFSQIVSEELVNPCVQAVAGAITGGVEVCILPVDIAKIKKQTDPALKNKSLFFLIGQEISENGMHGAYKGATITAFRNIPGSTLLFLGPALVYSYLLQKSKAEASGWEQTFANSVGAVASIAGSNPQDVVKIRQQAQFKWLSAMKITKDIAYQEGARGFFRGFSTKMLVQVPKLTLVATASDYFTRKIQKLGLFGAYHSNKAGSTKATKKNHPETPSSSENKEPLAARKPSR